MPNCKVAASRLRFKPGVFDYLSSIGFEINKTKIVECEAEISLFNQIAEKRISNYLGYPTALFQGLLPDELLGKLMLNVGDWRDNKFMAPNTHEYEFEATKYLKDIFRFPYGTKEWGNSCAGSSEAILAAIVYARGLMKAKTGKTPVILTSSEAHYSHRKCAYIAGLECISIKTDEKAAMDMKALSVSIADLGDNPIIVLATTGTTVREGYDPIVDIAEQLKSRKAESYLHIDAALCGFTAPFLDEIESRLKPLFHEGVDSISVSLHKFFGCNRPGALLLGVDRSCGEFPFMKRVEYIDAKDSTPSGSRNGHPVLAFAMLYRLIGREGFKKMAENCLAKAEYLTARLRIEGIQVFHNEGALTVVMPQPSAEIVDKYTLACSDGGAHVITMQHVTTDLLDRYIADYVDWYWSHGL